MDKLVRLFCLTALVAVSAFGQRGGGHGGGGFHGGMGGFHGGMGGFHGGGFHGGFGNGFAGHGFNNGFHGHPFFDGHNHFHSGTFFGFGLGFGAPWGWGWGAPWGWGWGGWPGGGYYGSAIYPAYGYPSDATPYTPSPNVAVIFPPTTGASDYTATGEAIPPAESTPVHFSIALRDNTIVDALAYWVDGGTLRYVDMQGKQQQVPLSQVDQARSQQLNRERGIEFGLPQSR